MTGPAPNARRRRDGPDESRSLGGGKEGSCDTRAQPEEGTVTERGHEVGSHPPGQGGRTGSRSGAARRGWHGQRRQEGRRGSRRGGQTNWEVGHDESAGRRRCWEEVATRTSQRAFFPARPRLTKVKPLARRTDTNVMSATSKPVSLPGWEERSPARDEQPSTEGSRVGEFVMAPAGAYRVVVVEELPGAAGSRRIEAWPVIAFDRCGAPLLMDTEKLVAVSAILDRYEKPTWHLDGGAPDVHVEWS